VAEINNVGSLGPVVTADGSKPGDTAPVAPQWLNTALPTSGKWSDEQALKVVLRDFSAAETYRMQNHDWRWRNADQTYLAWVTQKFWEGTQIPRASLQVHQAFQQIESLLPQVMSAIFQGDLDIEALPSKPGTTIEQALLVKQLLQYQLKNLDGIKTKFNSLRSIFRKMYKSDLIYGNGIAEWGWEEGLTKKMLWERKQGPEMQDSTAFGMPARVPTGRMQQWLEQKEVPIRFSQPVLRFIDLRDFYIDPNCSSPNPQEAQYTLKRRLVSVADLQMLRGMQGMTIPDDATLVELTNKKFYSMGDMSKQTTESYRGGNWQPTQDQSVDPQNARMEMLCYTSPSRTAWVIGRDRAIYNTTNEYDANPYMDLCYADVPGRFYGQGICDVLESDQAAAMAILNGRIDELNLILHAPIVKKRGMVFGRGQLRMRPGAVWEADKPGEDVIRMEMGNVTQQAFIEMDQIDQRSQKVTGVTDLASLGTPSSGGNSANRTATGINTQSAATSTRVHYQVVIVEDDMLQPLLQIMLGLNKKFLDPGVMMSIIGPQGQELQFDPINVLNADVDFNLNSGSRMKARAGLQNGGMMVAAQYLLNPQLVQGMAEQQMMTPDYKAIEQLFCDTYSLPPSNLYRQMTPQEQQAMQQRMQAPMQEKMAVQGQRLQAMDGMQDKRDETKLLQTLIKLMQDPEIKHMLGIQMNPALLGSGGGDGGTGGTP
jgi:hypothetical protein